MRDTMKPVRLGVYAAINGQVTYDATVVPVYDEKVYTGEVPDLYILLSTQQETPGPDQNDCEFIINSSIDIEIIRRTGSEVSKDTIDDVSDQIYELLMPTPGVPAITATGFQITQAVRQSAITRNISLTNTESILQKTVRIIFTILRSN